MRQAADPAAGRASGRRIIERPRLIKLLEGASARTILLIAPAGYGKTTLARQWAERQTGVHWYTARTGSSDVAQLAVDLAATLDDSPPKLADYVSQLVRARSSPVHQVTEIVEGFANAAGDLSSVSLFIDDYHVIAEEAVAEWLVHELQSRLQFRLFVGSRTRPNWATARLQMYGETVEFGAEELALTDAEATEVLGNARGSKGLLAHARGWPAVVGLAARTDLVPSPPDSGASTLFRFFAEELFLATPPDVQEKLITLALLPTLSSEVVQRALDGDALKVIADASESGFATQGPDGPELHPLVREYLLTKLRGRGDTRERVLATLQVSLDSRQWDHAFDLIERFELLELLDQLIERSFKPLLTSGRIATLERIANFAHASQWGDSPLIALVDAELAFRAGAFARTEAIATAAAEALGTKHSLTSHAWWLAGQAAQLSFDDDKASCHFQRARQSARDDKDGTNALWGLTMTLAQAEEEDLTEVLTQFMHRRKRSSVELVRRTQAELLARRATSLKEPVAVEEAIHALDTLTDPRVKTSFMNTYAYHLVLSGRYEEALAMASSMRQVADAYQLRWVQPHAQWALAASALGLRQFRKAEGWLRQVEASADELRYGQLLLNAACLRARLLLALQRPDEAIKALAVDETRAASRAMQGEYLATKALALAVTNASPARCHEFTARATSVTACVEARAYSACAIAVAVHRTSGPDEEVIAKVREAESLGVWDAVVATIRAVPTILTTFAQTSAVDTSLAQALRNSGDHDLARRAGIDLGRRMRIGAQKPGLSPRERDVFELIKQGLTNREIARTLFLSEATVKVHVRHILEKTGTRTRTEAATSTDFEP